MDFLHKALIVDAEGRRTDEHEKLISGNYEEIQTWSDQVYMPYRVTPAKPALTPASSLYAVSIGSMILTRFCYGVPVHLSDFNAGPGMGMALTTIRGSARHWIDQRRSADTPVGHTFLVDTTRTDYWVDFDPHHLQLNVTFPHQYLEELFIRWHGAPPEAPFWRQKIAFGGPDSSWAALLEYTCRCVADNRDQVLRGPLGNHLEELLGMHMLTEWSKRGGGAAAKKGGLAPRCVKLAEDYLRVNARQAPTLSRTAQAAGVSVRTLSNSFRQFRGMTPMAYLREQRLEGMRQELLSAPSGATVAAIAHQWGYASLGSFAAAYFKRYGELPSQTLARLRSR
ncbi:MAG TPA: helix-turn-helix transcriptional regulator [Duganella sp.]|nr:helix-turn-helix transcriptional regulator [Duganella sp.]